MLIATWNINSLKSRLPLVLEWLTLHNPDVVMLQEIKGLEVIYPTSDFEKLGYNSIVNLQATYNGVAIISKYPIKLISKNIPNFNETNPPQARYLEVEIENIKFINIYAPNGNPITSEKYTYKLNWLNGLYKYLSQLICNKENFIIGGDFNIIPYNYDVYNPTSFHDDALFQLEVRQLYFKMLNLGLTDVIDICYPNQKERYTWWSYRSFGFEQNKGIRIDHILLSPYITTKLLYAKIDKIPRSKDKPSDHTPVICKLNLD